MEFSPMENAGSARRCLRIAVFTPPVSGDFFLDSRIGSRGSSSLSVSNDAFGPDDSPLSLGETHERESRIAELRSEAKAPHAQPRNSIASEALTLADRQPPVASKPCATIKLRSVVWL